jgi:hypothetical protein
VIFPKKIERIFTTFRSARQITVATGNSWEQPSCNSHPVRCLARLDRSFFNDDIHNLN